MTERIQSVDRAIDLLLAIAAADPADAGVPALAKACGLNRATAWRLLKTLQARRLVTVDEANRERSRFEQVKRFTVLPRDFTMEDGEITPTLKLRRRAVQEHFADEIDALYAEPRGETAAAEDA